MHNLVRRAITGSILGTTLWSIFFWLPPWCFSILLTLIFLEIIVGEWRHLLSFRDPLCWLFMPCYLIIPFVMLITLNHDAGYRILLTPLFIMVFSFDLGGYCIGSLFGKHKIAPHISPGKTWQGCLGGYLFSLASLYGIFWYQAIRAPHVFALWFSLVVGILATAGDLFESWLKRRAHVKDTGNLLPGHGGLLDRFDSSMFVAILFYCWRSYLITIFGIFR
jgi:phosphatidate cytidylyltransferase